MKIREKVMLRDYTSLRAGGPAERLVELEAGDSLEEAIAASLKQRPIWVLGYGANSLISDQGLPGTVVINQGGGIRELGRNRFRVDSGAEWDEFIRQVIDKNLWGLEFTSGIPGGVGAAVAGNIAAYGHKVSDRFVEATMLNTADNSVAVWQKDDFGFDYRSSALQLPKHQQVIILDATFQLQPEPTSQLEYTSALKVAEALSIQPDSLPNRRKIIMETRERAGSILHNSAKGPWTAGSFFKNPVVSEDKAQMIIDHEETNIRREQLYRQNRIHGENSMRVSAAHVLLAAGFKRGQRWGNVGLHPDHILKVENLGNATAQEIYEVVQTILKTVKDKLDIELEPEVRFLGAF